MLIWIVPPGQAQVQKPDSLYEAASATSDPNEKAQIFLQLSQLTTPTDLNLALEQVNQATELADDAELLGDIYDQKGRVHFALGELDGALSSFREAKRRKEAAGNDALAARVNNRVGVVLVRLKRLEEAMEVFLESAAYFEEAGDDVNLAMSHNNMAGIFADMGDYENAVRYNELALPVFQENDIKQYEIITLTNLAGQHLRLENFESAIEYNQLAEVIGEELQDQYALGIVYNNFGQIYFERGEIETSLDYYEKSLAAKKSIGINSNLVPTYNNLGQSLTMLNRPREAIQYLIQGLEIAQGDELWHVTSNLSKAYSLAGEPDSSTYYLDLTLAHRDSIFTMERQLVIDELRTQYESEQQEMEIVQLEESQRQNRNLLVLISGLFGATLVIAFLVIKNNRKRRVIAQQNEKIEKQHVEKLLKEQELIGINAMLEGQEKEREKIAEELHDTIGSSLATLKLYIESLDEVKGNGDYHKLHQKASHLLEETYDDVRKIAHSNSVGVLIKKGLVPAVKSMALKISEAQRIDIQVIGTGLEDRLENSVEIGVFRTIQELLSNAVKHSGASEVVVQITQHDDILNIIVEDDGLGFDPNNTQWGMGYTTIQNRMDNLNGELTIDSSTGNGTTVILNVPVD
ncbi:tetratricopeptide repeat protein [Rhodohalobacter sulfatireducens]|uniref:tetratricopeptide repeat protein n=1 Tax=Rhodohalobacter sulfatireducens TaxID=2911366 RepID=UPI001EDAADBA|nr:tetratricopeptide repeat protein [Rhodohalobacter sulfatireducens]